MTTSSFTSQGSDLISRCWRHAAGICPLGGLALIFTCAITVGCGSYGGTNHPDGSTNDASSEPLADRSVDASPDAPPASPDGSLPDATPDQGHHSDAEVDDRSCFGPCLESLFAQCSKLDQACTSSTSANHTTTCYANGVKQSEVTSGNVRDRVVKKADGELCYEYVADDRQAVVFDPTGGRVAEITFTRTDASIGMNIRCRDGTTIVSDYLSPACAGHRAAGSLMCTSGSCTW